MTHRLLIALLLLSVCTAPVHAVAPAPPSKHRIVVMTDIGGDPDDRQSMVRFLLYACDFDVEGLCTGFGHGHYETTRPDLIREAVDAYGKVWPSLLKHRPDYPSHDDLRRRIKDGHNGDPHSVGPGMDSEASDWIIRVIDRDDPRPVWFSIWGGPRELAQAIWKVSQTRSAEELKTFKSRIRVHSIADQDRTAGWVKKNHPDVFWLYSNKLFRGIWAKGDQTIVSPAWLERHVRSKHGPLGPMYPAKAAGKDGVKEGDTPSFFYVLPDGLSDPEQPEWGNWGGRFKPSGHGREFIPALDKIDGNPDMYYTIHRWRPAYQNEFEARMDWCVKPFNEANHKPVATCNRDRGRDVLQLEVAPEAAVKLSAAGSTDPDGDTLSYRWWIYQEAGSYWDAVAITGAGQQNATVQIPRDASGRTIHTVLEVTDNGRPPLTAYRRAVLNVTGKPVAPPRSTVKGRTVSTKPVTRLAGPPAKTGSWIFYRGVNFNGPPVTIDGNKWQGDGAPDFVCTDKPLITSNVPLRPPTNPEREKMIQSFRWNRSASLTVTRLPKGTYAVYAYVWEETRPTTFTVRLNNNIVQRDFNSGNAGKWQRLGPWVTQVNDGKIHITSKGGDANFSGIEVWREKD